MISLSVWLLADLRDLQPVRTLICHSLDLVDPRKKIEGVHRLSKAFLQEREVLPKVSFDQTNFFLLKNLICRICIADVALLSNFSFQDRSSIYLSGYFAFSSESVRVSLHDFKNLKNFRKFLG